MVLAALGSGFLLPLALFAVLVPGGVEGLHFFFFVDQTGGGLGLSSEGTDRLGLGVLGAVSAALEGGAHNRELSLRPVGLLVIGWALLLGMVGALVQAAWGRRSRDPAAVASGVALSWLVPLALLPLDRWFYPLAYRYWVLLLALGFAVLPAVLANRGWAGRIVCAALASLALLIAPTLPRSIVAPAASRAEALVSSGAHRMNARPGRDPHAAFSVLSSQIAPADVVPLAEGYGLTRGGDMAVLLIEEQSAEPPWHTLPPMPAPARQAFLIGIGCGLTAVGVVPATAVRVLADAPAADRGALFYGLGRCAVDPNRQPEPSVRDALRELGAELPAGAWLVLGAGLRHAGRAEDALGLGFLPPELSRGWRDPSLAGFQSAVRDPAQLMPPRWMP